MEGLEWVGALHFYPDRAMLRIAGQHSALTSIGAIRTEQQNPWSAGKTGANCVETGGAMQNPVVRGIVGGVVGAATGLPFGLAIGVLLIQTVIPSDYWNEEWLLPMLTIGIAVPFGLTGVLHGATPNRFTTAAAKAIRGFVIGFMLGAVAALALSVAAAWLFSISQMEGAYAMSVVFVLVPLGGLLLGATLAIRAVLRP